jgi:hypothetical protein
MTTFWEIFVDSLASLTAKQPLLLLIVTSFDPQDQETLKKNIEFFDRLIKKNSHQKLKIIISVSDWKNKQFLFQTPV